MVDRAISDELHWIFREQFRADVGIDGQAEILTTSRRATGRILAMQIKSGPSWFREPSQDGWIFRSDNLEHRDYWIHHSMPVLLCLCDPDANAIYWVQVTAANSTVTGSGWKIFVPASQRLDASAAPALQRVASGPQHADICELLLIPYLQDRFSDRINICPFIDTPRDWWGLAYLAEVEGERVVIDFIYTPTEGLDEQAVQKRLGARAFNERNCFLSEVPLMLFLIGDNPEHVTPDTHLAKFIAGQRDLRLGRLVYDPEPPFSLDELREDNTIVWYGPGGERMN